MEAKAVKWGNSLAFRIPKSIAKECGLAENIPVDISLRGGEIVISPMRRKYALSELLAGMTPENTHGEIGPDEPVGQELL
jgi:antitoxin MazE